MCYQAIEQVYLIKWPVSVYIYIYIYIYIYVCVCVRVCAHVCVCVCVCVCVNTHAFTDINNMSVFICIHMCMFS